MPHVIEPAPTGRAKCRGCAQPIARGELRFGEQVPNPFGEGEATLWFHPRCAAYKRPESLLATLAEVGDIATDRAELEAIAQSGLAHRRLPRVDGAERAPSGKAKCRCCQQLIERGAWRIRLVLFEDGRFNPGGFIHLACRKEYFDGHDVWDRVVQFSPGLEPADRAELEVAYRTA